MKQYNFLLSLFSIVLVSSCITVPRIDKKDSRNNQFSQELQDLMAVKHPQKIDTTFKKSKSDTTWGPLILSNEILNKISVAWNNSHGDPFLKDRNEVIYSTGRNKDSISGEYADSTVDSTFFANYPHIGMFNYFHDIGVIDNTGLIFGTGRDKGSMIGEPGGETWQETPCKPKIYHQYVYIHDTVTNAVVNHSQIDAYITYLKASRDSTTTFQLKYSQSKSAGLIKLFVAIGLGILLILSIILYFQKK